jgi:ABC-2 type transport system permease protein
MSRSWARVLILDAVSRHRRLLLTLAAGFFTFDLLIAGIYDSLLGSGIGAALGVAGDPPAAFRALAGGAANPFTPEGWLSFGFLHPIVLVLLIAWTVAVAAGAVAGEVENGTGEFLFTRPVARWQVLSIRTAMWLAGLLVLLGAGWFGSFAAMSYSDGLEDFGAAALARIALSILPPLAVIAGVSFVASCALSMRSKAVAVGTGFAVASYFLNFASLVWEPVEPLAPLSVFHYAEAAVWAVDGVAWGDFTLLMSIGVGLIVIAHLVLERRDIAP